MSFWREKFAYLLAFVERCAFVNAVHWDTPFDHGVSFEAVYYEGDTPYAAGAWCNTQLEPNVDDGGGGETDTTAAEPA